MEGHFLVAQNQINLPDCIHCGLCETRIAHVEDYIPNAHDIVYGGYFNKVFNAVILEQPNYHQTQDGNILVNNTYCIQCSNLLGWKLIEATEPSEYFIEGRFFMRLDQLMYQSGVMLHDSLFGGANEQASNDQDGDANGQDHDQDEYAIADQYIVDNDQVGGANDQDGDVNEQVPNEQDVGADEQTADQDKDANGQNDDEDGGANDQLGGANDQDGGANDQVGGANDQDGGVNEQVPNEQDLGALMSTILIKMKALINRETLTYETGLTLHDSLFGGDNEQAPNDQDGGENGQDHNQDVGLNADQDGGANADQDGGANADQYGGANADQDGGANDQNGDINEQDVGANEQNADQDEDTNEQNDDEDGGAPINE